MTKIDPFELIDESFYQLRTQQKDNSKPQKGIFGNEIEQLVKEKIITNTQELLDGLNVIINKALHIDYSYTLETFNYMLCPDIIGVIFEEYDSSIHSLSISRTSKALGKAFIKETLSKMNNRELKRRFDDLETNGYPLHFITLWAIVAYELKLTQDSLKSFFIYAILKDQLNTICQYNSLFSLSKEQIIEKYLNNGLAQFNNISQITINIDNSLKLQCKDNFRYKNH